MTVVENRMTNQSPLLHAVVRDVRPRICALPSWSDAVADVDAIIASFQLHVLRRFFRQVHWRDESREALFSERAEPGLKLENVAAHSWHVADATLLIAPHFSFLNRHRALELAILHDKLEIYTGDFDPVGSDGKGTYSHAFHIQSQTAKLKAEEAALELYIGTLREDARENQRELLLDVIRPTSAESLFVKAIDKLQALAFVYQKKRGSLSDEHLVFSIRYSRKAIDFFPGIQAHYLVLLDRLIESVASYRRISRGTLEKELFSQLELDFRQSG